MVKNVGLDDHIFMLFFGYWYSGDTPLTHAARQGHTAVAKYLVDHGADPSIPSGLGTTALHHSAGIGIRSPHFRWAKFYNFTPYARLRYCK